MIDHSGKGEKGYSVFALARQLVVLIHHLPPVSVLVFTLTLIHSRARTVCAASSVRVVVEQIRSASIS